MILHSHPGSSEVKGGQNESKFVQHLGIQIIFLVFDCSHKTHDIADLSGISWSSLQNEVLCKDLQVRGCRNNKLITIFNLN